MNLFDHIKNHKWTYSLAAVLVLVVVGSLTYKGPVYDAASELTGNMKRAFSRPAPKTMVEEKIVQTKGQNIGKTSQMTDVVGNDMMDDSFSGNRDSSVTTEVMTEVADTKLGDAMIDANETFMPPKVGDAMIEVPIQPAPAACTAADWRCSSFTPSDCPASEERTRECYLGNSNCSNPDAVKPATTETCTPVTPELTAYLDYVTKASIVPAGSSEYRVSVYTFKAKNEPWTVKKLTILNDPVALFDTPLNTVAVSSVTIKYLDKDGVKKSKNAPLVAGVAQFSGLDMYVPIYGSGILEIYANVNTIAAVGDSLSGQTFRLGLQDTSNTVATFEAVSESSSTPMYQPVISGASSNPNLVVRKSFPTFTKVNAPSALNNGVNTLYSLKVAADNAGAISLGRLVFDMTTSGLASTGTEDIHSFRLWRGSTMVDIADVNIYGSRYLSANYVTELQSSAAGVAMDSLDDNPNNGILDSSYMIIVSFDQEETISAGSSQTYTLKAEVMGADGSDTITTKLSHFDGDMPIQGLISGNGTSSTGRISDPATSNGALFDTLGLGGSLCDESGYAASSYDFSRLVGSEKRCNIIWSDRSADNHVYPTVAAGSVTPATGSYDWTNGYLLNANSLAPQLLEK